MSAIIYCYNQTKSNRVSAENLLKWVEHKNGERKKGERAKRIILLNKMETRESFFSPELIILLGMRKKKTRTKGQRGRRGEITLPRHLRDNLSERTLIEPRR